jgi:hypothetical protein
MNKFEKLIEYIINDEDQKARELFHDIVVEKSRDIYESIMDEESMEETVAGNMSNLVDEVSDEEQAMEAEEDGEEEFSMDQDGEEDSEMAGDFPAGDEEVAASDEDKIMDIDAKLDELLAKFDEIMGDDAGEEPAMDMDAEQEVGAEEEPQMFEGENPFAKSGKSGKSGSAQSGKSGKSGSAKSGKSGKSSSEVMREYVETIKNMDLTGSSEGDAVGAAGKKTSVNDKSVTGPGADFGGNVVKRTGADNANPDGTSAPSSEKAKEDNAGNINVPGGKAGSAFNTKEAAKTAEGSTTDGSVPVSDKSVQKQNTGVKR